MPITPPTAIGQQSFFRGNLQGLSRLEPRPLFGADTDDDRRQRLENDGFQHMAEARAIRIIVLRLKDKKIDKTEFAEFLKTLNDRPFAVFGDVLDERTAWNKNVRTNIRNNCGWLRFIRRDYKRLQVEYKKLCVLWSAYHEEALQRMR